MEKIMRMTSEQRKKQIVKAAIKIIGEKGLREFTTTNIASEVGIKDATIFKHFKNKEEIVNAVAASLEEAFKNAMPDEKEDPIERLRRFFVKRVGIILNNPGFIALIFSDQLGQAGGKKVLERVENQRKKAKQYIETCIAEASEKGQIRDDIALDDLLIIIHGAVMGTVFLENRSKRSFDAGGRALSVFETILKMTGVEQ
jgi:AcrR family transcriptional regulator